MPIKVKTILCASIMCFCCLALSQTLDSPKPQCLYKPNADKLCETGFYSNCKSAIFCGKQRRNEAKLVCASHLLDKSQDRAGLIHGCYMGSATCYCQPK